MSKNETIAARQMVVKLNLSLHARQGFSYFLVPNFQISCEIILNFPNCLLHLDVRLQLLYVKVELFS